jgi:molybdopterin-guanine dinucleotide biosynthesis protein A
MLAHSGLTASAGAVRADDAAGFVLAGGESSRMGSDKALIELVGQPLIAHALATLREVGLHASIAGARSDLSGFAPVIEDAAPGLGPLSGVCAGLASASARWVVFHSIDLPLLPASLIAHLLLRAQISGASVTLASVNGFPQTFPAVIDREALPALKAELAAGRSGCMRAFQAAAEKLARSFAVLPAEMLAQAGCAVHRSGLPAALWFLNINTPAALERAQAVRADGNA